MTKLTNMSHDVVICVNGRQLVIVRLPEIPILTDTILDWYAETFDFERSTLTAIYLPWIDYNKYQIQENANGT